MAPVLARRWRWLDKLNRPIDGGATWRGRRVLGDHKTWRGLAAGWLLATALVLAQFWLYDVSPELQRFYRWDISGLNPLLWSTALTLGALGGDALKSFFKRQVGIAPGRSWVPFDQLDFVIGTLVAVSLLIDMPVRFYVIAVLLGLFLHPLVNFLSWTLRLQDKPY